MRSAGDAVVLAHGLSGGRDVPISLTLAMTGAGLAVLLSFVIMAALWRTSVLRGSAAGRPLPGWFQRAADSRVTRAALRGLGLALAVYFVAAAAYGPDDPLVNPTAGVVYIFFWVGLIPASLLFGPVWRLLNPLRTLHQLIALIAGQGAGRGLRPLPERIGYWPAAAGLLVFTWIELVAPASDQPRVLLQFFGLYAVVHLIAASIYGAQWFERADAFEAYSNLTARLSPLGRRDDGLLVLRNPFDGLDSVRLAPGLVALVCIWLGSTAYDGFTRSGAWRTIVREGLAAGVVPYDADGIKTIGFVVIIALATGLYVGSTALAARLGGGRAREMPGQFSHSLVPIAIGYTLAHYFSLAVFAGQRTVALASDPLDNGSNLFGTANYEPDYAILSDAQIAVIQVAAVITGHVLGAVAAHDRAARLFSHERAVTSQLPLLGLMLAYTTGGLSLLFAS
ncbi:MAG: hypothetical protein ACT4P1_15135 [Sporichthyaceae bacterium]